MRAPAEDPDQRKLATEISKRQKRLEERRAPFDNLYDDIDDYVVGRRANYDLGTKQGSAAGAKAGAKIYDQTASMALQDFVDGYQGNSAAPTIDWWSPNFRSKQVMAMAEARKWLDDFRHHRFKESPRIGSTRRRGGEGEPHLHFRNQRNHSGG